MNDWQEVPAWQALKALTEGTHDVECHGLNNWFRLSTSEECAIQLRARCRIRPKRRTMDVKGLPVPASVQSQPSASWIELRFASIEQAEEALRILETAREAQ